MNVDTFDNIVRDLCAFSGDDMLAKYTTVARAVRRVINDLTLNMLPTIGSAEIEVSALYTAPLPQDAAVVLKIGKLLASGKLRMMGRIDQIYDNRHATSSTTPNCTCAESETVEEAESDVSFINTECPACTFWGCHSGFSGKYLGYKIKAFPNGSFAVNNNTNTIDFTSGFDVYEGSKLIVVYTTLIDVETYRVIPVEYFEVIRNKVMEMTGPDHTKNYYQQRYQKEYMRLKNLMTPYTGQDIIRAVRSGLAPATVR